MSQELARFKCYQEGRIASGFSKFPSNSYKINRLNLVRVISCLSRHFKNSKKRSYLKTKSNKTQTLKNQRQKIQRKKRIKIGSDRKSTKVKEKYKINLMDKVDSLIPLPISARILAEQKKADHHSRNIKLCFAYNSAQDQKMESKYS